jgi:hypothetical protein
MKIYWKSETHVQFVLTVLLNPYHENLHKVGETCTNVLSVVNLTVHWLYLVYTSDQTTLMLTVAWKTGTNCNKIFKSIQQ